MRAFVTPKNTAKRMVHGKESQALPAPGIPVESRRGPGEQFLRQPVGDWCNNPPTLGMHPISVVKVKYEDDDVQIIGGTL